MRNFTLLLCFAFTTILLGNIDKTHKDSAFKRLLIADATFKLDLIDCKSIFVMEDRTTFYDSSDSDTLDFIVLWQIDWGDKSRLIEIKREKSTDLGIRNFNPAHSYNQRDSFVVRYFIQTKKGLKDTFEYEFIIPGPQPSFKFDGSKDDTLRIGVDECVTFINTTKKKASIAFFHYFFGDGEFKGYIRNSNNVIHCYKNPGIYYPAIEMLDSVNYKQLGYGICPIIWPDTATRSSMVVKVIEGLNIDKLMSKFKMYPNPSHTWIQIPKYMENKIAIYRINGSKITSIESQNDRFDISQLEKGIYLIYDEPNKILIDKLVKF